MKTLLPAGLFRFILIIFFVFELTGAYSQCNNGTSYPTTALAVPGSGGYITTASQYQSEYNIVNGVTAGVSYLSTYPSAGAYITVRSGSASGAVVAFGPSPLRWTASTTATHYVHYNTNASCGLASSGYTSVLANAVVTNVSACGTVFTDLGGAAGNYANSSSMMWVFKPSNPDAKVIVEFTSFSTEDGYDALLVYNGNATTGTLLSSGLGVGSGSGTCLAGSYRGAGSPGTITSTAADGSLTFIFQSDASTVAAGWTANVKLAGLNFAAESAGTASSTASGCSNATLSLGAGAYKDLQLAANTYYDFNWANAGVSNGYKVSVISGGAGATSSSFTTTPTNGWYSGSTAPIVRVSASSSNQCAWTASSATLTYKHATPSAVSVAGGGTLCTVPATITASGGSNGTVYWENTTSGGTSTATASTSQSVSAGTYYFRSGNNGCWGTEGSATVIAATNNPGALSIPASICAGTATSITNSVAATGGPSAVSYYYYYRGGPTNIGWTMYDGPTSSLTSALPSAVYNTPGTWYVARNSDFGCGQANNGTTVDIPMVVSAPSTAPTGISGAGVSICHGNSVTLTQTGGALASGASYEWFSGSCGGTSVGTGNSITIAPTATTSYYVRASAAGGCAATACSPAGTITLPTAGSALASNGESATCNVSGTGWIHFYSSGGNLIASINPGGNNLGSVTATAYVNGSSILTQACNTGSNPAFTTAALGRSWVITPTNNLAASVKFPFTSAEFVSLQTASIGTASNLLDNISAIGDVKMSHYSGVNQNGNWADNCVTAGGSGGTQLVGSQAGSGLTTTGNGFMTTVVGSSYVQFNTPSFSEFWLHGDGGSSPLPVELTSFSASCNGQGAVDINWTTASEHNSEKFIIEKSRDLTQWTYVSENHGSGNSTYKIDYISTDANPFAGISYYRLIQRDTDGEEKIYGPVSVSCSGAENTMMVFPNPTKGAFTVEVASSENISDAQIQICDLTGKVVSTRSVNIHQGQNQLLFENADLQLGTYIVRLVSKAEFKPARVVVN